jgi:Glycosyltransferase family 92
MSKPGRSRRRFAAVIVIVALVFRSVVVTILSSSHFASFHNYETPKTWYPEGKAAIPSFQVYGEQSHSVQNNNDDDAFETPAVQCRRTLDPWQNANIELWMESKTPWMEWIWTRNDTTTGRPYWLVMLLTIDTGIGNYKMNQLYKMQWKWQDSSGSNHTATPAFVDRLMQLLNDRLYLRLDPPTPFTSDGSSNHTSKTNISAPKYLWVEHSNPSSTNEPEIMNFTYDLQPYLQCSNIEKRNRPPQHVKVGACITRFWGQHDLLPEWIEYHRLIGVHHFWLFVAEPFENVIASHYLPHKNVPDITYVPYHYTWGRYRHNRPEAKLKFQGENMFQAAAINQCLYLAKQYELDWIYTPDVDEYVAILLNPSNYNKGNESYTTIGTYLERYNESSYPDVGSICMPGVALGRNPTLEYLNKSKFELTIDFTYRKNRNLGAKGGRRKCFYRPSLVNDAWIHLKRHGGLEIEANKSEIDLYHYRTPLLGVHENHGDDEALVSYPEIRDRYRDKVLAALRQSNSPLPNLASHLDSAYGGDLNISNKCFTTLYGEKVWGECKDK